MLPLVTNRQQGMLLAMRVLCCKYIDINSYINTPKVGSITTFRAPTDIGKHKRFEWIMLLRNFCKVTFLLLKVRELRRFRMTVHLSTLYAVTTSQLYDTLSGMAAAKFSNTTGYA